MKKFTPLLVALVVPLVGLAAGFEGKVTMKMTGPKGAPPTMTFNLKEGLSRIDMNGGGQNVAVIYDAAKLETTFLLLDQKMFMTQALPKSQVAAAAGGAAEATTGAGVAVTSAKEKILGYDCVKYVTQSKEGTSEIWVTDQLGSFLGFGGPPPMGGRRGPGASAPAPQGWEAAITGKGIFPLRVVTTSGGQETFRLEATNIEKAALPAALFYPPSDFTNLSEMLRGLGMPGGIPGMPGGVKLPGGE